LQYQRAEDDKEYVPEDIQATCKVHLTYVTGIGNSETKEIDEIEAEREGGGLAVVLPSVEVHSAYDRQEGCRDRKSSKDEDKQRGGEVVGEESGK
jgi:hypothetical protein